MPARKRLVLFAEGQGDQAAMPILVKHLVSGINPTWEAIVLHPDPFRVGHIQGLLKDNGKELIRKLERARKLRDLGGVLLLVDGEYDRLENKPFCTASAAKRLAESAMAAGAGEAFSFAAVVVRREFETWFLPCGTALAGKALPDGRPGLEPATTAPEGNLEESPPSPKKWMRKQMANGYNEVTDQPAFTRMILEHLDVIRSRELRSFRRMENAISQIVAALRADTPIVTPS